MVEKLKYISIKILYQLTLNGCRGDGSSYALPKFKYINAFHRLKYTRINTNEGVGWSEYA